MFMVFGAPVDDNASPEITPISTEVNAAIDSGEDNWETRSAASAKYRLSRFGSTDDDEVAAEKNEHTVHNAWGGSYTPKKYVNTVEETPTDISAISTDSSISSISPISQISSISPILSNEISPILETPKPAPVTDVAEISNISESN